MPLTFRSVSAVASASSGDLTMNAPAGGAQGDLYIADISYRSNAAFTPNTAGDPQAGEWEQIEVANSGNTTANSTGSIGSGVMFWCIRGSSEPDLVFNRTAGDIALGRITAYTPGSGETVALDVSSVNTLGSASTTVTTGTITTTADTALVHLAECLARNTTASRARAATDPDEFLWRERADSATTTGADCGLAISDATKFEAGATGTLTYTAGSSARHVAIAAAFTVTGGAVPLVKELTKGTSSFGSTNFTSGSFTPAADTILVVAAELVAGGATLPGISGGGLTWNAITNAYDSAFASLGIRIAAWWALVGGSPSSMTFTIDPSGTPDHVTHAVAWQVTGADPSNPVGSATVTDTHLTDTETGTLSASPAATSVVFQVSATVDVSTSTNGHSAASPAWLELLDFLNSGQLVSFSAQLRYNDTSTTIAWADLLESTTVASDDGTPSIAFEIIAASSGQTLTQAARLDNANTLHAAVVTADAVLSQAALHENANTLFAGSVGTLLTQGARLDNASTLFAATVTAERSVTQTARLDNANNLFAATVMADAVVSQGARLDNAATLFAGQIDLGISQGARLDNANTLFAAEVEAAAGAQTLTQTARLDNSSTLFAGQINLTLTQSARLDDADTLFAAVVTSGQALTQAARLDNANTLFAATVTSGSGITQAARLDNASTLFAATVTADGLLTQAARLDNVATLHAGQINLSLSQGARLDNVASLGAHTVTADALITQAARHDNTSTLFAATVSAGGDVTQTARLDNANVLFAATVTADATVTQSARLDNAATLFAPSIGLGLAQTARLDNVTTVYAAQINLTVAQAARHENISTLDAHSVVGDTALVQAARLDNVAVLYAHTLSLTISEGVRLDNAQAFGAHALAADMALAQAARLDNVSVLFAPVVTQGQVLTQAARLDNAAALYVPTIWRAGAYDTLRAWTIANVALPLRFENEALDPPAGLAAFCYFEQFGDYTDLAEIGTGVATAAARWREEGVALWHVIVASGTGAQVARGYAETIAGQLQGLTLAGGLRIEQLSVGDGEQLKGDGNYFAVPVSADWARDP